MGITEAKNITVKILVSVIFLWISSNIVENMKWEFSIYLGGFEHELSRVIKKSQRPFGESMRTHKNSRELHISLPWIHHLLGGETLEVNQNKVHKTLNKCKVPTIAEIKTKKSQ